MKKILDYIIPVSLFVIFTIFTILVKTVDVQYIEGIGYLGFYNFNMSLNTTIQNMNTDLFDKISTIIMIISFIPVAFFAILGIAQLIRRKSLKKVDPVLYFLLGLYIIIAGCYLVFSLLKINFAPYSTPDNLKDSYPSSHVFITFTLLFSSSLASGFYLKKFNRWIYIGINALASILAMGEIFTRMFSGKHYFTDIIGGILLAFTLTSAFYVLCVSKKDKARYIESC